MEQVVLVDEQDNELGTMEKLQAHRNGALHRAFSVFVRNSQGELLLQQRAPHKYHSGGLWTNTCCSHPQPGESVMDAANRRLKEEMGMHCDLTWQFSFVYKKSLDNQLIEHEFDHVLTGVSDIRPVLNDQEVVDYRYVSLESLDHEISKSPKQFTEWFKICLEAHRDQLFPSR